MKLILLALALFAGLTMLVILAGEDANPGAASPAAANATPPKRSLAEATDMLFASDANLDTLKVKFFRKSVWDEASWVHTMGSGVIGLGKFLATHLPDSFSVVKVLAYAPSTDKYGNDEAVPAMLMVFNGKDFEKINYANFSEWKMLSLVQEVKFEPIGKRAALKYCEDEDHAEYARPFCMKVLGAVLSEN